MRADRALPWTHFFVLTFAEDGRCSDLREWQHWRLLGVGTDWSPPAMVPRAYHALKAKKSPAGTGLED